MLINDRTYTVQDLAARYQVTPQTINRWISRACKELKAQLGQADPTDKRIRVFSEQELEQIENFIPQAKRRPVVEAEIVETVEEARITTVEANAGGLFDFSDLNAGSMEYEAVSIEELTNQGKEFDLMRGAALNALGNFMAQDAMNTLVQTVAETRHAIKGLGAMAAKQAMEKVQDQLDPKDSKKKK